MNYGRVLLTIPSKERVSCFPAMTILILAVFALVTSFSGFMSMLTLSLTSEMFFVDSILDILQVLILPISLLQCFVVSQVRIRLNMKF